jgi:crossover junction endodeoxyribonuclease RuvC
VGITARQYQLLQERLNPTSRLRKPAEQTPHGVGAGMAGGRVVLGIDPSLRGTGYGVIRFERSAPAALALGTIHCPARWARSRCLAFIATTLRDVIRAHQPETCVVEGWFHAQNLQTALVMGEARGAALVAAAEAGLEIYELAPRKVKQAMVGFGGAQKSAVARMVQRLLGLADLPEPDAADALALALTHAREQNRHGLTPPKPI